MKPQAAAPPARTLAREVAFEGVGLHTGARARLRIKPAPAGSGVRFCRTDVGDPSPIPALITLETDLSRRSSLRTSAGQVETVEHLLAAVLASGIDDVDIEIDGPEVPGGDGSAREFYELLREGGAVESGRARERFSLDRPVYVSDGPAEAIALPCPGALELEYELDYGPILGGSHWFRFRMDAESFGREVAPARTFCLESEAQALRAAGLGKGASYENTLVIGPGGPIENRYRFPDEPCRHKMLDLIGDLALLGRRLEARVIARKSGHRLNRALVRALRAALEEGRALDAASPREWPAAGGGEPFAVPVRRVLDGSTALRGPREAFGVKNLTMAEEAFRGHFPDRPVFPGVLIVEALADLSARHLRARFGDAAAPRLAEVKSAKFRAMALPGDRLSIFVEGPEERAPTALVRARACVGDRLVTEAELYFALQGA